MKDNELIATLITLLQAGRASVGIPSIPVKQAYQPTQQGVPFEACAFLTLVHHHRYGYLERTDIYDPAQQIEIHTEKQIYETTFQLSALAPQKPTDPSLPTASDVVNAFAAIAQSDSFRQSLQNVDLGILRISAIRNPYFADDRDRFEASPSFDFVITHKQIVQTTVPVLESTEFRLRSV